MPKIMPIKRIITFEKKQKRTKIKKIKKIIDLKIEK